MRNNLKQKNAVIYWSLFGFLFLLFAIFVFEKGHGGDIAHWKLWTDFIAKNGFANIYDFGTVIETDYTCNYPPVILYFFNVYAVLFPDFDALIENAKYFKILPLVFDFLSAAMIFLLVKRNKKTQWLPLLLLLCPAFMYNSYIWGQFDSILTAFIALALLFAIRKQTLLAVLFYIIALNTKMQAIVFFPIFILAIFPQIQSWKLLGKTLVTAVATQVILLLPFIVNGTVSNWYGVMNSLVDQYTNVSLNAFNFWHLVIEKNGALYTKDYQLFWWGLTYKTWGLAMFFIFSFFALLPILLRSFRYWKNQLPYDNNFKEIIFLGAFLTTLGFFFFNTQMHERYSHPAILMAFFFGVLSRRYWLYGITAIAYFLNMEMTLRFFDISYGTLIFERPFIASLFSLVLLIGLFELYKRSSISADIRSLQNGVLKD